MPLIGLITICHYKGMYERKKEKSVTNIQAHVSREAGRKKGETGDCFMTIACNEWKTMTCSVVLSPC